jgi:hypothetical protein
VGPERVILHSDGIISFSRLISRRIDVMDEREGEGETSTITHCLVCCHSDDFDVTLGGHTARKCVKMAACPRQIPLLQSRGTRNRYPPQTYWWEKRLFFSFHFIISLYVPVEAHLTDGIAFLCTVMEL